MALLRVGNLMRYVSPSVLTGFITGSGVYIFIGQVGDALLWSWCHHASVVAPTLGCGG